MKIIILTAPSGSGKTSITRHLLKTFPDKLVFSVSAATRKARGNEKNGVDYYFLDEDDFQQKIRDNAFVEWGYTLPGCPCSPLLLSLVRGHMTRSHINSYGGLRQSR